jgi:hypothetical protein
MGAAEPGFGRPGLKALALVVAMALIATRVAADNLDFIGLSIPWLAKREWLALEFDDARAKPVRESR